MTNWTSGSVAGLYRWQRSQGSSLTMGSNNIYLVGSGVFKQDGSQRNRSACINHVVHEYRGFPFDVANE